MESIDYDETSTAIGRMEVIRILLDFASFMRIKLYQMDVKCPFLNESINEKIMLV